jgi:DNA-binding CsgD family transcriptional regulator
MNITLRIIAILGILLFGGGFVFTYSMPSFVEEAGKDFIKSKVEEKTNEKVESFKLKNHKDNPVLKFTSKLMKDNENEVKKLKEKLKLNAHNKLAAVIAEMRNLDCDCRKKYAKRIKENTENRIVSLEKTNAILLDFMKTKYMEVSTKIKTDFRIFTGSNFVVFFVLLLVSFMKPKAVTHLFLPSILLVVSTLICSYFYIFEQNWFFTIIYNTYFGWGYLTCLGVVFAFLCDIVFNRARITTEIINSILNVIGSATSVVPLPC